MGQETIVGRPRESPFAMLELEDAKATIGRVLTERMKKKFDVQMVKPQDALGELESFTASSDESIPPQLRHPITQIWTAIDKGAFNPQDASAPRLCTRLHLSRRSELRQETGEMLDRRGLRNPLADSVWKNIIQ